VFLLLFIASLTATNAPFCTAVYINRKVACNPVGLMNSRIKLLKRNLDETEEELQKEKTQKRKYQRECEDMIESQEAMNREINSLKTKLR